MIELIVEKMKCGGCTASVEQAVKAHDPKARVETDLAQKKVRVDSNLPAAEFAEVISLAGYPAHVVS